MRFIVAAVAEVVRSVFSGSAFDTNAPTTTRRNRAPWAFAKNRPFKPL